MSLSNTLQLTKGPLASLKKNSLKNEKILPTEKPPYPETSFFGTDFG